MIHSAWGLAGSPGGFMPEVTLNLGLKAGQSGTIQRRYLHIMENTGKEVTRGKECERRHRSWRGCGMERMEAVSGNKHGALGQKTSILGSALVNYM